jgi:hypothetical protein
VYGGSAGAVVGIPGVTVPPSIDFLRQLLSMAGLLRMGPGARL